jgi:hypothetical protein
VTRSKFVSAFAFSLLSLSLPAVATDAQDANAQQGTNIADPNLPANQAAARIQRQQDQQQMQTYQTQAGTRFGGPTVAPNVGLTGSVEKGGGTVGVVVCPQGPCK